MELYCCDQDNLILYFRYVYFLFHAFSLGPLRLNFGRLALPLISQSVGEARHPRHARGGRRRQGAGARVLQGGARVCARVRRAALSFVCTYALRNAYMYMPGCRIFGLHALSLPFGPRLSLSRFLSYKLDT